jgi:hypothetical protein
LAVFGDPAPTSSLTPGDALCSSRESHRQKRSDGSQVAKKKDYAAPGLDEKIACPQFFDKTKAWTDFQPKIIQPFASLIVYQIAFVWL